MYVLYLCLATETFRDTRLLRPLLFVDNVVRINAVSVAATVIVVTADIIFTCHQHTEVHWVTSIISDLLYVTVYLPYTLHVHAPLFTCSLILLYMYYNYC